MGEAGRAGKAVGTVSERLIGELGIAEGDAWTDELAARVAGAVEEDKAIRDAMARLNRRALSRRDLDRKLRERGHEAVARAAALDRLTELGLIDDAAYGAALADEVVRRKAAGPRLVEQKLRAKGVSGDVAGRIARDAAGDKDAQRAAARAAAEKKLGTMRGVDRATQRRRLYGLLGRRGFDSEVIAEVMDAVLNAADEGEA
ncbi:MAG: regulatory protein RecX [Planctomycetota bacterium]